MTVIENQELGGERPLYCGRDLHLKGVTIHLGESSLKECAHIVAEDCRFEGKYVLWEAKDSVVRRSYFAESARSSLWYSDGLLMESCMVDAPKMFRRMHHIEVRDTRFPHAQETFWDCSHIRLRNVEIAEADYLFMHSTDIDIADYKQDGNYSFQYAKRVEIHNAVINSKDAFWESEDCTIYDSEINGEYLGWYAKRLRLVRCHITGEQPLCYCEDLVMEDCTMGEDANLALEYSTVEATICGHVTSIKNPTSGHVRVDSVGDLIVDANQKAPADCEVIITSK